MGGRGSQAHGFHKALGGSSEGQDTSEDWHLGFLLLKSARERQRGKGQQCANSETPLSMPFQMDADEENAGLELWTVGRIRRSSQLWYSLTHGSFPPEAPLTSCLFTSLRHQCPP